MGKIFVAWVGYLAYLVLVGFGVHHFHSMSSSWCFFPGYSVFYGVELWRQAGWLCLTLPWQHCIGCVLFGYLTFLILLIEVDQACRSDMALTETHASTMFFSDFASFSSFLSTQFKASQAPFIFVDDADVFCLVSYANFCGYPFFSQLAIFCHAAIKRLPSVVSEYCIVHEATHIYNADVWFRWWVDVFCMFLFFMTASDTLSAMGLLILLGFCRQGFVRAQEIVADFTALTNFSFDDKNNERSLLCARIESLSYLASFEEAGHATIGLEAVLRSCLCSHPQGWLRVAVQLCILRVLHYSVDELQYTFSWVRSDSRRGCCQVLLDFCRSPNKLLYGLTGLYIVLQVPFFCMVGLQRLCVASFELPCFHCGATK